ncbi:DUF3604 domain-containing protein [Curvibacter sp. APW13]|uniref:DUF3604 domain-containing protein n=1 Tax=Curvibacter sp. APW13 TaxID=3077236 RepID=UPI0028DEF0EE|nr:DUF3604 domain-containing protein [Curvibacter sp. APW13]MDT8989907.1 DUF3604 domain-containing protein [Curvibacter sp. APW13]
MIKRIFQWLGGLVGLVVVGGVGYLVFAQHDPDLVLSVAKVMEPLRGADAPPPNPQRNAYFGELHLHTKYSMDANVFGNRLDPRMAYRFAKGEPMEIGDSGIVQKLAAPLDFAAVTDHAEGMGGVHQCLNSKSPNYWSLDCIGLRYKLLPVFPRLFDALVQNGPKRGYYPPGICGKDGQDCIASAPSVWQDTQNAANDAYEPGKFTSFIGYEYSPTLVMGGMLHRNIIYRGAKVPDTVFGATDGFAEDLLRWLDLNCTGACKALSIPHNPNFSWGLMFGDRNSDASPVTRENLALRAKYERLVEVFQAKGGSECARGVGNTDEECGFENLWPTCKPGEELVDDKTGIHAVRCVAQNDMVRNVLKKGLAEEKKWGFNPFQFGLVGSTDNHNGMPGDTAEKGYNGHATPIDTTPEYRLGMKQTIVSKKLGIAPGGINPGGLTGVWAEENTRPAIWDSLQRRESWGTSGTRLRVRFFGGYGFASNLHQQGDMVKTAYAQGVPMGGTLAAAPAGKAPSFLVWALRDVQSAPLQRVQIVKGWLTADGSTQERVYDVACSDGGKPDAKTHRCPDNGAKVDLQTCAISQDKGAPELATTWSDPEFQPTQSAFYYVRVLENPVCRYSQYDALKLGVAHPPNVPQTIQERAWSSPIWYTPAR